MDEIIDGEVVEVSMGDQTCLARVERGMLAETLDVVFYTSLGAPVKAHWEEPNYYNGYQRRLVADAGGQALDLRGAVETSGHELVVSDVAGARRREPRNVGRVQARPTKRGWRASFTPTEDVFVTHFVIGKPGRVQSAGTFDQPVVIWKGHKFTLGIAPQRHRRLDDDSGRQVGEAGVPGLRQHNQDGKGRTALVARRVPELPEHRD